MLGAFVGGAVGTALSLAAVVLFFVTLAEGGDLRTAAVVWGAAFVVGRYLAFVSRRTVRARGRS